jgi:GNAT superfamily N-acetyltransferase
MTDTTPFTLRPAALDDAPAIARVHVESWKTTYADFIPVELHRTYETRLQTWARVLESGTGFVYVAADPSAGVVGFVNGGPIRRPVGRYTGELYAIYLLQSAQRRGIGRALVLKCAEELIARGFDNMVLWVLAKNPARHFYERMGGIYIATTVEHFAGGDHVEIGYGWRDLPALIGMARRD